MDSTQFTSIAFFQKKKDITLYRAADEAHHYILKSIITKDAAVRQAFCDEFETLSHLRHPSIPVYYWLKENVMLPGQETGALTLCMEDCSRPAPCAPLSMDALCVVMTKTAGILAYLLENGVLYTDLNPSNLIFSPMGVGHAPQSLHKHDREYWQYLRAAASPETGEDYSVTLIDYTYCYYFLRNPKPTYPLRFSYDISPQLKGQQFLIQALTFLFYDLIETNQIRTLPSAVCQLLETGRNPSDDLSLTDYIRMLRRCRKKSENR